MKKIIILSLLFIFALMQITTAQVISEPFNSQSLNQKRKIVIYIPDNYDSKETYPLLVVLDAENLMEPTIANARYYDYARDMPASIIVGVFNEKKDVAIDENVGVPYEESARFFEFIARELIPYIESKYPINNFRTMIASDQAASFANYFLLKENSIFNAYISINPKPLQKVNSSIADLLSQTQQTLFYYMATTDLDSETFYKNTIDLNTQIRSKSPSDEVEYYFEDFTGSSPTSVALTSIPRAFDLIFNIYKPISVKEHKEKIQPMKEDIFNYLSNKYDLIEKKLNIKKKPLMNDIMAVYTVIIRKKDWNSLLSLSEYLNENGYEKTAMPSFFLAEYYEEIGEPKKSLRSYQKAYTQQMIDFITTDLINERMNALKSDFGL